MAETKVSTLQLGGDKRVWTEDNLVSGDNVKIQKRINPNVLDPETTVAMYHFDGDYSDETANQNTIVPNVNGDVPDGTFYSDTNTVKFINPNPSGDVWQSLRLTSANNNWTGFNFTNTIPLGYSWTIDFWILLPDNYGDIEFVASKSPLLGVMFNGGNGGSNKSYITFRCSNSYYQQFDIEKNMNDHVYHHIAIVMDNSVASIYIDGELNNTFDFGLNWVPLNLYTFRSTGKNFPARFPYIDELRFSNIAMWSSNFTPATTPYTFTSESAFWELNTTGLAKTADLATVATTGAYSDLTGAPTIPTVNNATLTITQGGTTKGTFTANASSDVTIALDAGGGGSSLNLVAGGNIAITEESGESGELETVISTTGVFTPTTLVGSSDITIAQVPQPVIDSNTVALFHLDDSLDNEITGSSATLSTFKFGSSPTLAGSIQNFGNCAKIVEGSQASLISDHGVSATSFTLDFLVKSTNTSSNSDIKLTNNVNLEVKFTPTALIIDHYDGYNWVTDHSEDYTPGTMVHIAFTGASGLYRVFINGVKCAEVANTDSSLGDLLNLGNSGNSGLYFDEIRVSNIDRYNGVNFTPFTQPYAPASADVQYAISAPTLATKSEVAGKQDQLTAGTGITIVNNVISSTTAFGVTYYSNQTGTTMTIADTTNAKLLKIYKNGLLQAPTADYTVSGTTLTFVDALVATDTIAVEIVA